jgi:iron complex transport system substrate-binding protein
VREPTATLCAALAALAFAGCEATDTDDPPENARSLKVQHALGQTRVPGEADRPVALYPSELDSAIALGAEPVGAAIRGGRDAFPRYLGKATAPLAPVGPVDRPDLERVAALEPDVILALYAGLTDDEYDTLSEIAPTVAQPGDHVDWGIPWQEQTRTIGRALGQADEADALVQNVEDQLAQARADHPEFEGATGVMATPYQERISVYAPEDVRGRFMADLGFVPFEGLEDLAGDEFAPELSLEQTELLDVDALVWILGHDVQSDLARLHEEPLYGGLSVVAEGREVAVSNYDTLGGATSFQTVLSVPVLIDGLVPMLAAAVDGDPATVVEPPT